MDPYEYTKSSHFTSELYKIEIKNLPRFFGYNQFKKYLQKKYDINPHKMKYVRTKHPHLFITFKNEKDQLSAIEKLNDIEYKNCKLIVKIAKPSADPFIISNQTNDNKTTIKNVKDVVTPYWNISYLEQLKLKQTNLKDTLIVKLGLLDGIENILKNMEPSPLIYGYRNKCEFTIGHLDTSKLIGFRVSSYKSGCDLVAPIDECLHVSEEMKSVVKV
ncbi:unnamed protein product [Gordionus sp. m RMFG-2023]